MASYEIKNQFSYPIGHVFRTEDGNSYTVIGFLGRGGQGEVYRVRGNAGDFAVKWYYPDSYLSRINAVAFYKNLSRNVQNGIPRLTSGDAATEFIWPIQMVLKQDRSFGYMMRIFPPGYEQLKNVFMLRKKSADGTVIPLRWKSWFTRITAALNIVRAFEILHASGYSYQDLNDGGISVNMENGNVMICDCDNVSPDKTNLGIRGVMTYMAPEVVRGEKLPDRQTDEYSLAVILFRLFLNGHPMNGQESSMLHNSENLSQQEADLMIYGSRPHYCLASVNNINPPDPVRNEDVLRLGFTYPLALMDAFEQVFTKGVNDPGARLTATEWRRILLEVRDSLVLVHGQEQFYYIRKEKPLPKASRVLVYPHGSRVLLMPDKILYRYHFSEYGADFKTPAGKIIPTSKEGVIGLYNAAGAPIRFTLEDKEGVCPDKGRMPLLPGMQLEFGKLKVKVE